MKKITVILVTLILAVGMCPLKLRAAGGIYASGGGTKTVGDSFTVTVAASGATFNALEGTISVSGPVSVTSFSAGSATWITAPSNGTHFKGMVSGGASSLTVATIKLKATGTGSGSVSVSSVRLANAGSDVGSGAGSASFNIQKAPDLPGAPKVSSSSHPDQNTAYEATTIALAWTKDSGVDGFSYLLDQAEKTALPAKITNANTSVSYADKAIGVYYFHIRAHKADGWGGTTHFKINIKEPDAKIDTTLSAPSDITIEKGSNYTNNIKEGTVTGLVIKGKTVAGFTANVAMIPAPTLPEGKTMSAAADSEGNFELILDFPIFAGYHKLTVQGQKDKVLTPVSEEITFEISQTKGGTINILTDSDINPPETVKAESTKNGKLYDMNVAKYAVALAGLILLVAIIVLIYIRQKKNKRRDF